MTNILSILQDKGSCILRGTISRAACEKATTDAHHFLHDSSFGLYPKDPVRRPSTHQNGAGWLFGDIREAVADQIYSKIYDTGELWSSKEGFIYFERTDIKDVYEDVKENESVYYRSMICIDTISDEGCVISRRGHDIVLQRGDVFVWKAEYGCSTSSDGVLLLSCMLPAGIPTSSCMKEKMTAYKERRTSTFHPDRERSFTTADVSSESQRQYFRFSPAPVTIKQTQLYGLLPYQLESFERKIEEATVQGVRFFPIGHLIHPETRSCEASLKYLEGTLIGADKYLGGMTSSCGKYVYGVPGHAKRVLKIDCETETMECIGPEFTGKFKWLRGLDVPSSVMNDPSYPLGCCLALPCNAFSVLKINPASDDVKCCAEDVLKDCGATNWLYHGGTVASNGWLYAIPANAKRVLKFNPTTEEALLIGPTLDGGQKFYGGILGSDNRIYGVPHNATSALVIDPSTDEVSLLEHKGQAMEEKNWKFHGGLRAGTKIYCFPNNSDSVLVIDCDMGYSYLIDGEGILKSGRHRVNRDNRYKYLGGALSQDGRFAYLFPCDAEQVLRINTETDALDLVGPLLLDGENKFQNGFVGNDGCLYAIPQRADSVLRISPAKDDEVDDHVELMPLRSDLVGVKDKFEGGVLGKNGKIYMMPLRAEACVAICPDGVDL